MVRNLQKVDISERYADIFRLPAGEASGEVRIAKKPSRPGAIERVHCRIRVGDLALRRELLPAVKALSKAKLVSGAETQNGRERGSGQLASPQAIWNEATYRFPTLTFFTAGPISSTTPQNSCPRMSPLFSWMIVPAGKLGHGCASSFVLQVG